MELLAKLIEINSVLVALGMGTVISIAVKIWRTVVSSKAKTEERFKNLEFANLAILHDKIYTQCSYFIEQGWIPVDDLENLDYLWRGYRGLNGNGTGETLYNKVKALSNNKPKEE
ncbi:hypothetical protein IGI39_003986 [Enterococcus sp. AZ135]|uniref:hypothetical protein n=1 Tax=unclassified Enterococcus TaxID=2608891 RepID=UPI003F221379